jgi:hypothetical protein
MNILLVIKEVASVATWKNHVTCTTYLICGDLLPSLGSQSVQEYYCLTYKNIYLLYSIIYIRRKTTNLCKIMPEIL